MLLARASHSCPRAQRQRSFTALLTYCVDKHAPPCPAAICFNRSNRRIRYLSLYFTAWIDRFKELSPVSAASAQLHVSVNAWNCAWLICPLGSRNKTL